jgi:hypothetical protein
VRLEEGTSDLQPSVTLQGGIQSEDQRLQAHSPTDPFACCLSLESLACVDGSRRINWRINCVLLVPRMAVPCLYFLPAPPQYRRRRVGGICGAARYDVSVSKDRCRPWNDYFFLIVLPCVC